MIVRHLNDAKKTERRVISQNWESIRLVLRDDQVGFSFHITTMYGGTETTMWYRNHLESCYCLEGDGEIESLDDGSVHPLVPGTIYILDKHDHHIVRARTDIKIACVFNPPLTGKEVHGVDGSYPLEA